MQEKGLIFKNPYRRGGHTLITGGTPKKEEEEEEEEEQEVTFKGGKEGRK